MEKRKSMQQIQKAAQKEKRSGSKKAIRLAAFDLDGTLAPLGRGINSGTLRLLRQLEKRGVRIAVCSGKPTYYLCALMRQAGLRRPILAGENGAVICEGVDLPPREFYFLPCEKEAKPALCRIKEKLDALIPDLWYQPNLVALTPFWKNEREFRLIADLLERERPHLEQIEVYRHSDSFDLIPKGIDKGAALRYISARYGIDASRTAAVGDGENDYPMFAYAGFAIGLGAVEENKADACVKDIKQALKLLKKRAF